MHELDFRAQKLNIDFHGMSGMEGPRMQANAVGLIHVAASTMQFCIPRPLYDQNCPATKRYWLGDGPEPQVSKMQHAVALPKPTNLSFGARINSIWRYLTQRKAEKTILRPQILAITQIGRLAASVLHNSCSALTDDNHRHSGLPS